MKIASPASPENHKLAKASNKVDSEMLATIAEHQVSSDHDQLSPSTAQETVGAYNLIVSQPLTSFCHMPALGRAQRSWPSLLDGSLGCHPQTNVRRVSKASIWTEAS